MASAMDTKLKVVFGAMTIGKPGVEQARVHTLDEASALLDVFQQHGHRDIDTARTYGEGSSEEYLGGLDWQTRGIVMHTKYYPMSNFGVVGYTHSPEHLRTHLTASLKALKTDSVDLWYLHGPDRTIPYETTMRAVNDLYKEGLRDSSADLNGWIRPSVYQGIYNPFFRSVEAELFPCLRHYGMSFYAYNPLAGGFLTSRYSRSNPLIEEGSRFDPNRPQGKMYRSRYMNDSMYSALETIREAAGKLGRTEAECTLRWIMHHSNLSREHGDAVIIGASNCDHLRQNLVDMEKDALPESMVEAFDKAWDLARGVATFYFY